MVTFMLKFVTNVCFIVVFYQISYKEKIFFFLVFFTKKNCKNEAKIIANLANIRKNVIQNLEIETDIMTELFELKTSIRSKVSNLLLKEWFEGRYSFFCSLCYLKNSFFHEIL